jgi:short-subunit dehydrogenase
MPLNPEIIDWKGLRVWLIGASSGIGESLARALAVRGARLALSARRAERLMALAAHCGEDASLVLPLDITEAESVARAAELLRQQWQGCDLVIVMAGDYVPLSAENFALAPARALIEVNLQGPLNVLAALLPSILQGERTGIALVSSVAGYKGLPRSLVYGPSKAALINLAESLYLDLHPRGCGVWVINPGFVRTPLTAQNDFDMPFIIGADEAADQIISGFAQGLFEIHFPKRFSRLLKFLQLLPYSLYFRLVARITR